MWSAFGLLLVTVAGSVKASPGGGDDGGWGPGYTEYNTQVYTTEIVSQYYHVRPSICTTYSVWQPPPDTSVYTKTSIWTEPGKTTWYTSYIPYTTTLPGKDTTYTKETTYTTQVTDTYSTTIYKPVTVTEKLYVTEDHTITLETTNYVPTTIPTTIPTTQLIPTTVPTTELVPTTIPTTQFVPKTYVEYSTITVQGSTRVLSFTKTETVPTTVLQETVLTVQGPTEYYASPTTVLSETTLTKEGTTEVLTTTLPVFQPGPIEYSVSPTTIISETTLTREGTTEVITTTLPVLRPGPTISTTLLEYSTISLSGSTEIISLPQSTVVEYSTVSLSRSIEIISLPQSTIVEYSTISLGGSTEIISLPQETIVEYSTLTANGTTEVITVQQTATLPQVTVEETLPGDTIIQSLPGETVYYTASAPTIISYVTITQPAITITKAPPPPASTCNATGFFPAPDGGACNGQSCYIDFDLDDAVHWDTIDHYPPLLTKAVFENPKATCITTICNTAVFDKYYTRSLANCARPPCPSNSLDCDCNIVVGPLVLPNGKTISVTQTGPSGWYLNLGPSATAVNVPTCMAGDPQCLTSVPTTRPEPLIYTGNVKAVPATGNMSYATPTQFLLPGLPAYFPLDSPFGDCSTAVFDAATSNAPRLRRAPLHRRQNMFANPASYVWAGTPSLIPSTTFRAQALSQVAPSAPMTSATPVPSPGTTVTEQQSTVTVSPSATSPEQPSPTNGSPPPNTSANPPSSTVPSSEAAGTPPSATGSSSQSSEGTGSTTLPAVVSPSSSAAGSGVTSPMTGPGPTSAPSGSESIGSSIFIPTSVTTGTDGRITVTETVFYSMIPSPGENSSISGSASGTSSGVATQSGGGAFVKVPNLMIAGLILLAMLLINV